MLNRLTRLRALTASTKRLHLSALWRLAAARAATLFLSYPRVEKMLRSASAGTGSVSPEQVEQARLIGRIVARVGRNLPWECRCLVLALAVRGMLHRKHIANTVFIGVKKAPDGLHSHAWLRVGDRIITGDEELESYQVITQFD